MRQRVTWVWGMTGFSPHRWHSSCMWTGSKPRHVWEGPSVGDHHTRVHAWPSEVLILPYVWKWHLCWFSQSLWIRGLASETFPDTPNAQPSVGPWGHICIMITYLGRCTDRVVSTSYLLTLFLFFHVSASRRGPTDSFHTHLYTHTQLKGLSRF